jgi:hypothetical protein
MGAFPSDNVQPVSLFCKTGCTYMDAAQNGGMRLPAMRYEAKKI